MAPLPSTLVAYVNAIKQSGLSIYDPIEVGDPNLWIPASELEALLDRSLEGVSFAGLPIRTRSKVAKEQVARALGYPVPSSFAKTQPRFVGQRFDTYVQKSNNLQVWNEELDPSRRYVLIRVNEADTITRVKVVGGESLALLDTTGTLTQKYQARLIPGEAAAELISAQDTERLAPLVKSSVDLSAQNPIANPMEEHLLSIQQIFEHLTTLLGEQFPDPGHDQERNRGADLHRLVCEALGYKNYADDGQFPDVKHQLLEVKLQTSPTIDLGLVQPSSDELLDISQLQGTQIRHCDVRYALFYAGTDGETVTLTNFYLTTGEDFFSRFPQFQGKVLNKKLQIPLPGDFFDS